MGDRALRLFASPRVAVGTCITLDSAAARHARVMRLRPGSELELFDGRGWVATACLRQMGRAELQCEVLSAVVHSPPARRLTLWLGLTKGDRPDLALRMLTELGVSAIGLVHCERSVVRAEEDRGRRPMRLQAIAREACAQSGNPFLPEIHGPSALVEMLSALPPPATQARVALHERADQVLGSFVAEGPHLLALVGPEGGLSASEVDQLRAHDFAVVRMATPILRAETAAVVAAARLLERM